MRLSELTSGLDAITKVVRAADLSKSGDPDVRRVVADSRRVQPGDAFCAVVGHDTDGHRFVAAAVQAGAAAVFAERPTAELACPQVLVADSRRALAYLAHRCLGNPARGMTVIGVTGTNGKTTVTYMLESILKSAGHPAAVLGTVAYRVGDRLLADPATHVTTPGADELAEMFAQILGEGVRHVVMEVSSHALDQGRVEQIGFRAAVFTNLTGDHRDYHLTPEHYFDAKARLFEGLAADADAVLNRDRSPGELTPYGQAPNELLAGRTKARVTWYGLSAAADVSAQVVQLNAQGAQFKLTVPGEEPELVRLPLIGRHNVSNAVAAAAAAWRLGVPRAAIVAGLEETRVVPGRLELVARADGGPWPVTVLVDYAHTHDALRNVLSALRPLVGSGRIVLVFGCGGNRDREKRPKMAAVAAELADHVIVTSDNPRNEDPEAIIDEVMAGVPKDSFRRVVRQADRRSAIQSAIGLAGKGDIVLIAGKGHEDYQILGRRRIHFDDREVAAEALAGRFGLAGDER